jgi:hypothetical protein
VDLRQCDKWRFIAGAATMPLKPVLLSGAEMDQLSIEINLLKS